MINVSVGGTQCTKVASCELMIPVNTTSNEHTVDNASIQLVGLLLNCFAVSNLLHSTGLECVAR